MYSWIPLLYTWNYHNIVSQFYSFLNKEYICGENVWIFMQLYE